MQVRTRFAPSPTGYLHLGGLRTALYTYLFTRKNHGVYILRIEDTDQERLVEGATEKIYRSLRLAGLDWDEGPDVGGPVGPYIQTERRDMYLPYAQELVRKGKAYYCFCTKEELAERRAACEAEGKTWKYDKHCCSLTPEEVQAKLDAGVPYVIRQNVPESGEASFDDVLYGHITVDCSELDDNVLIKQDGLPTYNFANVIDDHTMGITHVLRGNEYLSSTPKYNLLYDAFGWEKPVYIHLTPVMADATRKLSKRYGDPSFEDLLEEGYLKEAVVNYISLVGWNPGDNREFFTMDELIEAFSLEGLSKSPAIFDKEKCRWMNAEYIRRMTPEAFDEAAGPWYEKAGIAHMDRAILAKCLQPRVEVFSELPAMVDFLTEMPEFSDELYFSKKMKTNAETAREDLPVILDTLEKLPAWNEESVHDALINLAQSQNKKNGVIMWPLRIAISGKAVTPCGAVEIAVLLGRDETLARIRRSLAALEA